MNNSFDIETVAEIDIDIENYEDIDIEMKESGPPGFSAYEVYIKNGGTLTEIEWLESLKGEPGPPGKGEKGDIGDTGYTLTNTIRGESVTIEDAVEFKLFNLEIDGKSVQNGEPTPDTPIEIESIGYENLLNLTNGTYSHNGITAIVENGLITLNGTATDTAFATILLSNDYSINDDEVFTISANNPILNSNVRIRVDANGYIDTTLDSINKVATHTKTSNHTLQVGKIQIRVQSGVTLEDYVIKPQLEKGLISHSYIPYGKNGIEVKTTGKNLFDKSEVQIGKSWHGGSSTNRGSLVLEYEPNKDYTLSLNSFEKLTSIAIVEATEIKGSASVYTKTFSEAFTFTHTMSANAKYLCIQLESTTTFTKEILDSIKIQLEKGTVATEYEEYKSNTTVLALNEPLRSLPNGVKDKAYIKNNKLYVDRYIKSIVFNGSENWGKTTLSSGRSRFTLFVHDGKPSQPIMSDYFKGAMSTEYNYIFMGSSGEICLQYELSTVNEFKTWLSNNNVQVDYELETPITEEVGDCVIYTYAGVNNIDLGTEISVTYAQDMKSILKNYPSMEEVQNYVDSQLGTINEQLASLTEVE